MRQILFSENESDLFFYCYIINHPKISWLNQGLANIFCKEEDSKYLALQTIWSLLQPFNSDILV